MEQFNEKLFCPSYEARTELAMLGIFNAEWIMALHPIDVPALADMRFGSRSLSQASQEYRSQAESGERNKRKVCF